MPKVINEETGEVVMDDLTSAEIEALQEHEVEFDVPETDLPDVPEHLGEMDDDEKPEKLVESEMPEPEEARVEPGDGDVTSPTDHDIVGGELHFEYDEESLEEFADADEEEIEKRYDVKLDEAKKVDERDRARWANLINELNEYGDDVEVRKRERDARMESNSWASNRSADALRQRARNNNVIADLQEGFRQMVSRPTPKPAVEGPQMDAQNVVRKAAGDPTIRELFEEEVVVETGDRCIGIASDISGSMGSDIDELKIAGGAVATATEIIGDDFVWEAFTDKHVTGHTPSEERLDLRIVTGPNESFEWEHVNSFGACWNEPTAAGVRDCRMLMEQTSAREYLMIVITDGMALVTEDGRKTADNEPVEHARQAVNECRDAGIDVIGIGIGSMSDKKMRETFGEDGYRLTNIDSLADDILGLYADQMNVDRGF